MSAAYAVSVALAWLWAWFCMGGWLSLLLGSSRDEPPYPFHWRIFTGPRYVAWCWDRRLP